MAEKRQIPFGPADIIIGDGGDAIRFDGKSGENSFLQAEGGSISIEPTFADITSIDFGESPYDQYSTGVAVTVTVIALQESVETLKLAIASAQDVVRGEAADVTGVTDAPVGQSNRDKGVKVTVHPRNAGTNKDFDYTIYKMAPSENFEREFSLEQGTVEIQFTAYPRDGADASKGANFFYTGAVDPNASAEA